MIMKLYSIKDTVVGHFRSPAQFNNDSEAIRAVKYALKSVNDLSRNCKDYQMWCLGEFDTETGVIKSDVHLIANLIDHVDPDVYELTQKPDLGGVQNG